MHRSWNAGLVKYMAVCRPSLSTGLSRAGGGPGPLAGSRDATLRRRRSLLALAALPEGTNSFQLQRSAARPVRVAQPAPYQQGKAKIRRPYYSSPRPPWCCTDGRAAGADGLFSQAPLNAQPRRSRRLYSAPRITTFPAQRHNYTRRAISLRWAYLHNLAKLADTCALSQKPQPRGPETLCGGSSSPACSQKVSQVCYSRSGAPTTGAGELALLAKAQLAAQCRWCRPSAESHTAWEPLLGLMSLASQRWETLTVWQPAMPVHGT